MALNVSMTGSGSIGNITPNWSVQEGATPVAIGDAGASTGTVSFTARSTDDSLLCINNDVISTVNGFGTLHGIVQSVNETGMNVSLTHGTELDKLNLDFNMPPLIGGDAATALDYAEQAVLRRARTTKTVGDFYTLNGHNYSFIQDANGFAEYQESSVTSTSFVYPIPGGSTISYDYDDIRHSVDVDSFRRINDNVYADGLLGKMFFSSAGSNAGTSVVSSKVFFKTFLDGGDTDFSIYGKPISLVDEWYLDCNVNVSYVNDLITLQGVYAPGGDSTPFSVTASIAGLDTDEELAVFIHFYTDVSPNNKYYIDVKICNTSNYGTFANVQQEFSYGMAPIFDYFKMSGNIRSLYQLINSDVYEANACAEYEIDSTIYVELNDTAINRSIIPASSHKGVLWEYLQMACAARNQEIFVNGDVIGVREVGSRFITIDNVVASPSITPTSTLSGRQINIPYSNAYFIGESINEFGDRVKATIYDAAEDGNNIISVEAGAVTVVNVKFDVNPISVYDPTHSETYPVGVGEYHVVDSSGLSVLAGEWEQYGGNVTAEIDPNDPSAITITVTGPSEETTLAGGPYRLAASSGNPEYAALKIAGTGLYFGDSQLGLITGIDSVKYTRATVNTINNPFIGSVTDAYDRGVWASLKASGPVVTLNATIPDKDIVGIGETSGALFDYRDSTYRVVSNSINEIATSINAERHVTIERVDDIWETQTVAQYDSLWGAYECQDQIIFPYLEA